MTLCKEERLMEIVECSQEARNFQVAADKLAAFIRRHAALENYGLDAACKLIECNEITACLYDERGGGLGLTGLPSAVALYLTASACGGLFPQSQNEDQDDLTIKR